MNVLVSVIFPVYGTDGTMFRRSLESIISQTYDELEVVVVVDPAGHRSDGEILSVLEEFHDDHRMRTVVNKSRLGFTRSLNEGLRIAHGQLLARMDSDDVSAPERIESELDWLRSRGVDLVGTWTYVIKESGAIKGTLTPPSDFPTIRRLLLLHNPFVHSSIVFTRRLLEVAGPYREVFEPSEDYEFYLRAISRGFRCANVPSFLHSLREREGSISKSGRWKQNRVKYINCKVTAVTRYGFVRPLDIVFSGLSPISILVRPRDVLHLKQAIGQYQPQNPE